MDSDSMRALTHIFIWSSQRFQASKCMRSHIPANHADASTGTRFRDTGSTSVNLHPRLGKADYVQIWTPADAVILHTLPLTLYIHMLRLVLQTLQGKRPP